MDGWMDFDCAVEVLSTAVFVLYRSLLSQFSGIAEQTNFTLALDCEFLNLYQR
jgi:hypothetical protein